jgi:hypothetical protein
VAQDSKHGSRYINIQEVVTRPVERYSGGRQHHAASTNKVMTTLQDWLKPLMQRTQRLTVYHSNVSST